MVRPWYVCSSTQERLALVSGTVLHSGSSTRRQDLFSLVLGHVLTLRRLSSWIHMNYELTWSSKKVNAGVWFAVTLTYSIRSIFVAVRPPRVVVTFLSANARSREVDEAAWLIIGTGSEYESSGNNREVIAREDAMMLGLTLKPPAKKNWQLARTLKWTHQFNRSQLASFEKMT